MLGNDDSTDLGVGLADDSTDYGFLDENSLNLSQQTDSPVTRRRGGRNDDINLERELGMDLGHESPARNTSSSKQAESSDLGMYNSLDCLSVCARSLSISLSLYMDIKLF